MSGIEKGKDGVAEDSQVVAPEYPETEPTLTQLQEHSGSYALDGNDLHPMNG
jgi:hypothetical protein